MRWCAPELGRRGPVLDLEALARQVLNVIVLLEKRHDALDAVLQQLRLCLGGAVPTVGDVAIDIETWPPPPRRRPHLEEAALALGHLSTAVASSALACGHFPQSLKVHTVACHCSNSSYVRKLVAAKDFSTCSLPRSVR